MNYNFMADCQSRGFDETYLSMLSILSNGFTFNPGCISKEQTTLSAYYILGDKISIILTFDSDNHILFCFLESRHLTDATAVGSFNLNLEYEDGLIFPIISGSMCTRDGYFIFNNSFDSDNNISNDGIMVSYYDNDAIKYLRHNGGTFESNFIDPDKEFTFQTGDEKIENVVARLVTGRYNGDLNKAISSESKVYCKK